MSDQLVVAKSGSLQKVEHWRAVMEAWLNTLDSKATRKAYRRHVEAAMREFGSLAEMDPLRLTAYRDQWVRRLDDASGKRLSPASVLQHLAAVRSFLRFARIAGQTPLTHELIQFVLKSPRATVIKPYQILNDGERSALLSAARENLRDRVLLTFAIGTGLREAEICALTVSDLNEDDDRDLIVHVRQGKGRKDRLVPLDVDTGVIVRAYLSARKLKLGNKRDAGEYLFASRNGRGHGRLSTARLRQLIAQYVRAADISKPISMHSLRHTAAITWLNGNAPVTGVQKLLGHASLSTTQRYADHFEMQELKAIVNGVR